MGWGGGRTREPSGPPIAKGPPGGDTKPDPPPPILAGREMSQIYIHNKRLDLSESVPPPPGTMYGSTKKLYRR